MKPLLRACHSSAPAIKRFDNGQIVRQADVALALRVAVVDGHRALAARVGREERAQFEERMRARGLITDPTSSQFNGRRRGQF